MLQVFLHNGNTLAAAQGLYDKKLAAWTARKELIEDDCIEMIFEALDESFGLMKEEFTPRKTCRNTRNSAGEEPRRHGPLYKKRNSWEHNSEKQKDPQGRISFRIPKATKDKQDPRAHGYVELEHKQESWGSRRLLCPPEAQYKEQTTSSRP